MVEIGTQFIVLKHLQTTKVEMQEVMNSTPPCAYEGCCLSTDAVFFYRRHCNICLSFPATFHVISVMIVWHSAFVFM